MNCEALWSGISIGEEIGYGSYGTVYRTELGGKEYALKVICIPEESEQDESWKQFSKDDPEQKAWARTRTEELLEELRLLQRFQEDPHIVSVVDHRVLETETGYALYLLMEMLEPFSDYITTHRMGEQEVIRLGLDLCSALEACERENVVHRDLKPDNILVTRDGRFKLCDFGEAKDLERTMSVYSVRGTFSYMAPEVYRGRKYDRRADIYELGLIMYRLLNSGKEPFLDPSARIVSPKEREDAMNRRLNGEDFPLPKDASAGMSSILLKACAYYPEKRYPNASAMKAELLRLQKGSLRVKKTPRYGKRKRADYLKRALVSLLAAAAVLALFLVGRYEYLEHFVNYCDTDLQREIEEAFGTKSEARLNGNGVLYINSIEDLFCTEDGRYPWMLQKDLIRRVVFGKNMTGSLPDSDGRLISFRSPNMPGVTMQNPGVDGYIAPGAFSDCRNLREVTINSEVFCMEDCIFFRGCYELVKITCPAEADVFLGIDETVLSDTAWYQAEGCRVLGTTLVRYNGDREVLDDIPATIRRVDTSAFLGQETLKKVLLPEDVHVIARQAFAGCTNLEEVLLPKSLTTIEGGAFEDCASLRQLEIPQNVNSIGYGTFRGCGSLDNLTVHPDNAVFTVKDGVLYDKDMARLIWCSPAIEGTFQIPESVKAVEGQAFFDANALERLEIPHTLEALPTTIFGACPCLIDVAFLEENQAFLREDAILYGPEGTSVLLCMRNAEGSIVIAEGARVLTEYAFCSCSGVTEVILPDTLGYIMNEAFRDCTSLTSLTIPASVSMIGNHVFDGCASLRDLYYQGTEDAWQSMTARFDLGLPEDVTIHFQD